MTVITAPNTLDQRLPEGGGVVGDSCVRLLWVDKTGLAPWGLGSRKINWEAGVFWGGFLAIYGIYQVYRARGSSPGARIVANQPSQRRLPYQAPIK